MSFDEIFHLTAGVYFHFYNINLPSFPWPIQNRLRNAKSREVRDENTAPNDKSPYYCRTAAAVEEEWP